MFCFDFWNGGIMGQQNQWILKVIELQKLTGFGIRKIAKRLNMSHRTLQAWKKGTVPDRAAQILLEVLTTSKSVRKKYLKSVRPKQKVIE